MAGQKEKRKKREGKEKEGKVLNLEVRVGHTLQ